MTFFLSQLTPSATGPGQYESYLAHGHKCFKPLTETTATKADLKSSFIIEILQALVKKLLQLLMAKVEE